MLRPLVLLCLFAPTSALALPLVIDFDNSKGIAGGDPVVSGAKRIGRVTRVGFGAKDTVEVAIDVADEHRGEMRRSSTFVIVEGTGGRRPSVEYFVIDPKSPLLASGEHVRGSRSLADVWLRRGRVTAEDLRHSLEKGVEEFQKNLETLQRSEEWARFKSQLAQLSAELAATGTELSRLLNEQLPKVQRELDDLYRQYQKDLDARMRRTPTPGG